jgi:hypothetical protein
MIKIIEYRVDKHDQGHKHGIDQGNDHHSRA